MYIYIYMDDSASSIIPQSSGVVKKIKDILGSKTGMTVSVSVVIVVLIIAIIMFIISNQNAEHVDTYNADASDDVKSQRTKTRGSLISVYLTFLVIFQALLKSYGAEETPLLLYFGFITAAVIGYMGDQGYGTDEWYSILKNKNGGMAACLKYCLGSLMQPQFMRYILTVLLDMFISAPLLKITEYIPTVGKLVKALEGGSGLTQVFAKNFDNILQSFVGFITFLAYTNDTRFSWAYAGELLDSNQLLSTGTIKLAVAIAGLVFLIATSPAIFTNTEGHGSPLADLLTNKWIYVIIALSLMTFGSGMGSTFMDPKASSKKYTKSADDEGVLKTTVYERQECSCEGTDQADCYNNKYSTMDNWQTGLLIFGGICGLGVILPVYQNGANKTSKTVIISAVVMAILVGLYITCSQGAESNEKIQQEDNDYVNECN